MKVKQHDAYSGVQRAESQNVSVEQSNSYLNLRNKAQMKERFVASGRTLRR